MATSPPRLLLAEDDPVSAMVLEAASTALPAHVVVVGTCDCAMAAEHHAPFDAWLLDAHLPDGDGMELLARLRALPGRAHVPALAHTAGLDAATKARLRDAGFEVVIAKPVAAAVWQEALRQLPGLTPHWDDAAALRALQGAAGHVATMRHLFLADLPMQRRAVNDALDAQDVASAQAQLHRLRGSCGFVGAAALAAAVAALSAAPLDTFCRARFNQAVEALLTPPR